VDSRDEATFVSNLLQGVERILLAAGAILISAYFTIVLSGSVFSRVALWEFDKAQAGGPNDASSLPADEESEFSHWDTRRLQAYKESLRAWAAPPMAVLSIEKLRLRVPVFDGTDDAVLNRGVGHIEGTAALGESGNVGIAGHRDGFFRGLKDVVVGDRIDVVTSDKNLAFAVDEIKIVAPDDIYVLHPRPHPSLTLVTCYPFYFVGSAPQRYIVHASVVEPALSDDTNKFRATEIATTSQEDKK